MIHVHSWATNGIRSFPILMPKVVHNIHFIPSLVMIIGWLKIWDMFGALTAAKGGGLMHDEVSTPIIWLVGREGRLFTGLYCMLGLDVSPVLTVIRATWRSRGSATKHLQTVYVALEGNNVCISKLFSNSNESNGSHITTVSDDSHISNVSNYSHVSIILAYKLSMFL